MAAARMALCRSSATDIVARSRSQSRVEPSMSVKRKVTIPEGGAKGMIGVDGTATMTCSLQSRAWVKTTRRRLDLPDIRDSDGSIDPWSIPRRGRPTERPDYVRTENRNVKTGENRPKLVLFT